jgi:DNA invertase Pin-like site-specific DNA recombinase
MRAALYLTGSSKDQDLTNQELQLRSAAERMGHEIVGYKDNGISGAKSLGIAQSLRSIRATDYCISRAFSRGAAKSRNARSLIGKNRPAV